MANEDIWIDDNDLGVPTETELDWMEWEDELKDRYDL